MGLLIQSVFPILFLNFLFWRCSRNKSKVFPSQGLSLSPKWDPSHAPFPDKTEINLPHPALAALSSTCVTNFHCCKSSVIYFLPRKCTNPASITPWIVVSRFLLIRFIYFISNYKCDVNLHILGWKRLTREKFASDNKTHFSRGQSFNTMNFSALPSTNFQRYWIM